MYTDYGSGLTITVLITSSAYYCSKDKEIRQFLSAATGCGLEF